MADPQVLQIQQRLDAAMGRIAHLERQMAALANHTTFGTPDSSSNGDLYRWANNCTARMNQIYDNAATA